jgi:hypothetical protein
LTLSDTVFLRIGSGEEASNARGDDFAIGLFPARRAIPPTATVPFRKSRLDSTWERDRLLSTLAFGPANMIRREIQD